MARIILFLAFAYFSVSSQAAIEFNNLIQSNIAHQNELANDIQNATQVASSVDESHVPAPTSDIATPTAGNTTSTPTVKDKDFSVKLKNTGRESALRYFPPKPPRAKKKSKSVASVSAAKTKKQKSKSIASVETSKTAKKSKTKKTKTSNTKLVKENKKQKTVGLIRTQASVEKTK